MMLGSQGSILESHHCFSFYIGNYLCITSSFTRGFLFWCFPALLLSNERGRYITARNIVYVYSVIPDIDKMGKQGLTYCQDCYQRLFNM